MNVTLEEAVDYLNHSHPVAIPTETVWGLAARWDDDEAIRKIFLLKGRPLSNPLIIHVSNPLSFASCVPEQPPMMKDLMKAFWPGGLTLVVPVDERRVSSLVRAGLSTAAFRMPDHMETLELILRTGPLVAPSANRSGSPSATTPEHIEHDFGVGFPILKAASYCRHGIESTILIWDRRCWRLGRLGAIGVDVLAIVLGYEPTLHKAEGDAPLCPGQCFRHYAPEAKLSLSADGWEEQYSSTYDGVLGFSDRHYPNATNFVAMGSSDDPRSVSYRLYASLRDLDRLQLKAVFVDTSVPASVDWMAILDRLYRASK